MCPAILLFRINPQTALRRLSESDSQPSWSRIDETDGYVYVWVLGLLPEIQESRARRPRDAAAVLNAISTAC